jgi:ATP-dependent exoDNAse (exonuclease V) alpha subunit
MMDSYVSFRDGFMRSRKGNLWRRYAVTCHKAQGDEWNRLLVIEQNGKWDHARWAYTAASRAKVALDWVVAA